MLDKEKPILFSTPMVQSLDFKTATRRVMNPQPVMDEDGMWLWKDCQWMDGGLGFPQSGIDDHARYQPGDILWVRETWSFWPCWDCDNDCNSHKVWYRDSDGCFVYKAQRKKVPHEDRWRPSIFMPKEAARIFLRVTDVRAERLQDISEADAKAEGIKSYWLTKEAGKNADDWHDSNGPPFIGAAKELGADLCFTRREAYQQLWDCLNAKRDGGKYAWDKDPWVWVIEFERCAKPQGWPEVA